MKKRKKGFLRLVSERRSNGQESLQMGLETEWQSKFLHEFFGILQLSWDLIWPVGPLTLIEFRPHAYPFRDQNSCRTRLTRI
jgi:hypothetical protein